MSVELVKPALEYLPSYKAALERNWSPDNVRLLDVDAGTACGDR